MTTTHTGPGPETVDINFLKQEFNKFRAELSGMKEKLSGNAAETLDQISAYLNGDALASRLSALESKLEHLGGKLKDTGKTAAPSWSGSHRAPVTSVAWPSASACSPRSYSAASLPCPSPGARDLAKLVPRSRWGGRGGTGPHASPATGFFVAAFTYG